jgi:hypothetical protein
MKRHSGPFLLKRLETYLQWLKGKGEFMTLNEYAEFMCRVKSSLIQK